MNILSNCSLMAPVMLIYGKLEEAFQSQDYTDTECLNNVVIGNNITKPTSKFKIDSGLLILHVDLFAVVIDDNIRNAVAICLQK